MKTPLIFLLAILVLTITGCKKENDTTVKQPKQIDLPDKASEVIAQSNDFGFELFRETAMEETGENLMLSPLSASVALTMLLNGCDGNTYGQIHEMLGYQGLTIAEINNTYQSLREQLLSVDPEVELALGNAVWYRQDFYVKPPFLDTMQKAFSSHVEALDFTQQSALDDINGWASDNTNGKIKEVLTEISPDAVMFLMNALYFKGTWTWQFDKASTTPAPFHNDNGNTINTDMMMGKIPSRTTSGENFSALELYYGRQNFSMIVILPSSTVNELLQDFDAEDWKDLTASLDAIPSEPWETDVMMPKFTFEYEKKLNDQLQALGMTDAFNPSLADLSGISDQNIFVSFVKQNTFVNVDEEGTEAAAVTTIGIELTSLPEAFVVDKSFIFAIRERTTNTLMFIGQVMEP